MKRYLYVITLAAIVALSGCSSQGSSDSRDDSSTALISADNVTEIARVTGEVTPEDTTRPPQLMVEYSGDGVASAAMMTTGNYTWDGSGVSSAGAVSAALNGEITADVDLDLVSDGEPKIGLRANSEISGVKLYSLDSGEESQLDFTSDGVITFPADITNGVVSVLVEFPQGEAEYYFAVHRSQTDLSEPPALRIYQYDMGFAMTKGGYTWTVTTGDEAMTATVDCPTPWQMSSGDITRLVAEPGSSLTIALPEDSRIASAVYYTSEDESQALEYTGGTLTMPSGEVSAVCCVTVEMPQGSCDYVFGLQTGTEFNTPAFDPGATDGAAD